jgi:hypothetical protein
MKRQKERARQEKQREKAERKRQRRLESKNRAADGTLDSFQIDDEAGSSPSTPEPDLDEPHS